MSREYCRIDALIQLSRARIRPIIEAWAHASAHVPIEDVVMHPIEIVCKSEKHSMKVIVVIFVAS